MTPSREDLELYVTGNYDGDIDALERAIERDSALAAIVAEEARLESVLRDTGAAATFCVACSELGRGQRCDHCGAAVRPGGYLVERVLVSNAHGRMYVARDADGKRVALKELAFLHAPSPAALAAFEREAKFLRALEHPAIPRFVASFEEGSGVHTRYYLAQELVAGKALDELDDHWYSEAEIVDIAKQVLEILVYLQSLSPMVIHRDIKPANLLKRPDGTIALVDFGAAHVHGTTAGVTTIGTFGYMPLEQLAGVVDATTDVYALGASLLHLLTRQEPWRLAQTKVTVNVSAPLRAYLDKLVAPDPKNRFASAKVALAALDTRDQLVARRGRRPGARIAIATAASAALMASGAVGYSLLSSPPPTSTPPMIPFAGGSVAQVRVSIPTGSEATLHVDGVLVGIVHDGSVLGMSQGEHQFRIVREGGASCDSAVELTAGKVTTLECDFGGEAKRAAVVAPMPPAPKIELKQEISKRFTDTPLQTAMQELSDACGVSFVLADDIRAKVTADLSKVPCDQAIEVILESNGLWYAYTPAAKLVRISPRRQLDAEAEEAQVRAQRSAADDELPPGDPVDLDLKDAPLHDALRMIGMAGGVNIVVPDGVRGKVTIRLKNVPWNNALEALLSSHGLWYRYRASGKIVRVAPRRELDAEAEAELQRSQTR
jgi:serine/threonine protein kinase